MCVQMSSTEQPKRHCKCRQLKIELSICKAKLKRMGVKIKQRNAKITTLARGTKRLRNIDEHRKKMKKAIIAERMPLNNLSSINSAETPQDSKVNIFLSRQCIVRSILLFYVNEF